MRLLPIAALLCLALAAEALADAQSELDAGIDADRGGKYADALAHFSNYIALAPGKDEAYSWRGIENLRLGRFDEAIADYTKAIEINPAESAYYRSRGLAYAQNGDYGSAEADDGKAIAMAPDDASAYVDRANVYVATKRFKAAIADCNTVIDMIAEHRNRDGNDQEDAALAHANCGIAYSGMGRFEQAIAEFTDAIKAKPDDAANYVNRANAYINLDDGDSAIADCTAAIKMVTGHRNRDGNDKGDLALAYANRGIAHKHKGQKKPAIADLKKALELDPRLSLARKYLTEMGAS